jgi:hypothetical protein
VDFSVGQEGHEIEGGSASVAGAPPEGGQSFFAVDNIQEVVLQPQNWIGLCRLHIFLEKFGIAFRVGKAEFAPFTYPGETVEGEEIGVSPKDLRQGEDLIQIVPSQGEHDHGIDLPLPKYFQESHDSLEVSLSSDRIVVFG